ncbi:hypothetical protein DFH06DRAFT_459200 [Mycena polygramma]|nr:hypothetical protein DFH06DRAFT_459200 [Mycena polygramma]
MESQDLLPDATEEAQIRSLLRSHFPLPPHLKAKVSALADEFARSEKEIPRLRARLSAAEASHLALKERYERFRCLEAPIRLLPSELLLRIFKSCEQDTTESDPESREPVVSDSSTAEALAELARKPLLTVSQVCTRWHDIVLGTPTLWNTIELDSVFELWFDKRAAKTARSLLQLILDRSGSAPLTFGVTVMDRMHCKGILKMLAQHCERWRKVSIYCRSSDLRSLRSIKGRLPLLEMLELEIHDPPPRPEEPFSVDLFELAPRLQSINVGGRIPPSIGAVHLDKLDAFGCLGQNARQVACALPFMARMPEGREFRLELYVDDWMNGNNSDLPATTSDIANLSMDICDCFEREDSTSALDSVFASLTLPHLRTLTFSSVETPCFLIPWTHSSFLALAARSSFSTHLESLCLCDVVVTEAELLGALAVLPSLQHLEISDHRIIEEDGADQLLVTDSLFSALTLKFTPDAPSLVPLLQSILCQSILQFDDHVYLEFVLFRLRNASNVGPFESRMYWLPGHCRAFDVGVATKLRELCIQKELVWEFARAALWQ